ncbi:Protein of uncharacterised function (DUF1367) [Serratia entomophila]|uniref:DUF1367 family protein n=1 Tax=Serratia entomophila TaxID=42906 RepID=UPI001F1E8A6E|nr:DUF1367 family protein [Serratia entomophila]UIW20213.1 DUF1367 family protein [Serratia entomophila]CAI0776126.1 Protein of uncharacterised function (DUF1367) [Serratia entomophila]CAI0794193.1 Protein of uncharacterised function (DUF1367) [Serratia entomophila]CAI0806917.1 Protein of uncharacterised function (DUF1367) [Serratia entomophila]CAI0814473.1 Protein of uncharacterised function (DUF1367) [Serratia entomophila]
MTQLSFIKTRHDTLTPATAEVRDFLHNKVKIGAVLSADFKRVRNPRFHRKYFSLLNLGFEYWTPTGGTISPEEKSLIRGYVRHLAEFAGHGETLNSLAKGYLRKVAAQRADRVTLLKSFDAFRRWATIEAGYYTEQVMPNGVIVREPTSISFASMDDTEFAELYKQTLNVLWQFILNKTFTSPTAAENAASQLMEYAA